MSVDSLDTLQSQHVVFKLDSESDEFTYSDVLNRIQLRKTKMSGEDKRRHGAVVHRREYSDAENERRTQILFECGGIYDDQLDDEESVREFKRRRGGDDSASPRGDEKTKSSISLSKSLDVAGTSSVKSDGSNSSITHNDGGASPVISDSDSD